MGERLGSSVLKTWCFHCWGPVFDPWLGNPDPTSSMIQPKNKKHYVVSIVVCDRHPADALYYLSLFSLPILPSSPLSFSYPAFPALPSFALSSASRPPLCLSHVVLQSMPYHPSLGPGSELTLFSWACPELCLTDHHVNKHRKAKWYSTCVCCIWFTHLSLWGHMTWSRLFAAVNIDVLVCLSLWF